MSDIDTLYDHLLEKQFIPSPKPMITIDKYSANMHELIRKFNDNPFITQEFYEEYEFTLMEFSNCLATERVSVNYEKIQMDLDYSKKFTELRDECKSNADCEAKTDWLFAERKAKRKSLDNVMNMYNDLVWNYRRWWGVMQSSIIWNRQDEKRQDTAMQADYNSMIA